MSIRFRFADRTARSRFAQVFSRADTRLLSLLVAFSVTAACGDSGPGTPTLVPPPTTSVSVVVTPNPLRIGETAQANGTAHQSNGQTQSVTSGFLSDVPTVARVTDGGAVTGVSNGLANVYVVSGGRQGLAAVRVVPDYLGRWSGGLFVTECTANGVFADFEFCDAFPVGWVDPFELAVSQSGGTIDARPNYGPDFQFPSVDAAIRDGGEASFTTTYVDDLLSVEAVWTVNAPTAGTLTGTVDELWRVSGFTGEARLRQNIVMAQRSSSALAVRPSGGQGTRKSEMPLLRRQRH